MTNGRLPETGTFWSIFTSTSSNNVTDAGIVSQLWVSRLRADHQAFIHTKRSEKCHTRRSKMVQVLHNQIIKSCHIILAYSDAQNKSVVYWADSWLNRRWRVIELCCNLAVGNASEKIYAKGHSCYILQSSPIWRLFLLDLPCPVLPEESGIDLMVCVCVCVSKKDER